MGFGPWNWGLGHSVWGLGSRVEGDIIALNHSDRRLPAAFPDPTNSPVLRPQYPTDSEPGLANIGGRSRSK